MRHFSDEMDRMWSGQGRGRLRHGDEMSAWRPVIDVRERDGQLQVHADLPGVNENEVRVAIENETLIIQGERRREEEREDEGWYRSERSYGSFYRSIPLPQGVESDKANARFNNGVLEVTIPVPKSQQNVRQIPISTTGRTTGLNAAQSGNGPTQQQSTQPQGSAPEKTSRAGGS